MSNVMEVKKNAQNQKLLADENISDYFLNRISADVGFKIMLCLFTLFVINYKMSLQSIHQPQIQWIDLPEVNNTNEADYAKTPKHYDYLVRTAQCYIPYVDPYTKPVLQIYRPLQPAQCAEDEALIESVYDTDSKQYRLHINEQVQLKLTNMSTDADISCCYQQIVRHGSGRNVDRKVKLLSCTNFHQNFSVPKHIDGIIVKCKTGMNNKLLQEDAFSFVQLKENKTAQSAEKRKPSVLMLGIDNISSINFRRTMPKTFKYVTQNNWYEMLGYNKMGDNTFPNLMAVLAGLNTTATQQKCKPTVVGGLDKCEFIWQLYKNYGYRTAYAEDEVHISTFNYLLRGFEKPPTDYYMRPFLLGISKALNIKKHKSMDFCIGRRQASEYIYEYALQFAKRYKDEPIFGLFWMNSYSHDSFATASTMDLKMQTYLRELQRNGILDTTIIIFFSDHGTRWGPLVRQPEGFLESRLPMLFIWLPLTLRQKYPDFVQALELNRHRLTSPYDLHMTLKHLLELDDVATTSKQAQGCAMCQTLLRAVPENRTCDDAGITAHWCTCQPHETLDRKNKIVQKIAGLIIVKMNNYLKMKKLDKLCSNLTLKSVDWAEKKIEQYMFNKTKEKKQHDGVYRIKYTVVPKEAEFEVTTLYNATTNVVYLNVETDISRLTTYQNQSECITDKEAKKYCICESSSAVTDHFFID